MKKIRFLVLSALLPVLVACGGGGSGCAIGLGGAVCGGSGSPSNVAPVARAGSQSVLLGSVTLDGSASTDANGDALTYKWALFDKPAGSQATFDNASSAKPVFTADLKGTYVATLVVNDGKLDSSAVTVKVSAAEQNASPVANAGPDQSVLLNAVVMLDGRDSTDANREDVLTFKWLLSKPDGTTAELTGVRPTFKADATGIYVATLTVNDGVLNSNPVAVRVLVSDVNAPPVAVAGVAQTVIVGTAVTMDGAASSDANRDVLTYKWAMVAWPGASAPTLTGALTAKPTFAADPVGLYVLSLVVNDGKVTSEPSTVAITVLPVNVPPVALAGAGQTVVVGAEVSLSGLGSTDANGDVLSYGWSLTSLPAGSAATLTGATTVATTFRADVAGVYVATLTVSDGRGGSSVATVPVTATAPVPVVP